MVDHRIHWPGHASLYRADLSGIATLIYTRTGIVSPQFTIGNRTPSRVLSPPGL